MKKISLSFLIILFGLLLISKNCQAETEDKAKGFSITPYFQEITLSENQESAPFQLEVANNNDTAVVLRLSMLDFGALDESGGVAFLGSDSNLQRKYGLASWIDLENDTLVLNPGERQTVRGTIRNKESLSPGGHYGAIFLKTEKSDSESASNQNNIALDPSFASLLFVRKIGGEIYGMQLNNEGADFNFFFLPKIIRLRFQNTGNVHVVPRGVVEAFDPLGRKVAKGIINNESSIILPETFRIFPTALRSIAPIFIPGKYQFFISYRYDGQADFAERKLSFWLIPVPFLGTILILAGIIFAFWRQKRKLNQQE